MFQPALDPLLALLERLHLELVHHLLGQAHAPLLLLPRQEQRKSIEEAVVVRENGHCVHAEGVLGAAVLVGPLEDLVGGLKAEEDLCEPQDIGGALADVLVDGLEYLLRLFVRTELVEYDGFFGP